MGMTEYEFPMCTDSVEETREELLVEVLQKWGRARTRVGGNSMLPTLRVGDILNVEAARAADLSPGDIILCFQNGTVCTHRVVDRRGTSLVTRGDANVRIDPPVRADECIGRVASAERDGKPVVLRYRPMLSFLLRYSALTRNFYYWSRVRR